MNSHQELDGSRGGAFIKMAPVSERVSSTEHLSCRHPKLSTLSLEPQVWLASLAKRLNKFWRSITMFLFRSSGGPHPLINPHHSICRRVSSQVKSPSTSTDFGILRILLISHTYQHIMPRTDTETHQSHPFIAQSFFVRFGIGIVKG